MNPNEVARGPVEAGVLASDAAAVASSPSRLATFVAAALRARVWGARRVLAYGIAPDVSLEDLLSHIRATGPAVVVAAAASRASTLIPADMVGPWWRALGRVVALQSLDENDLADGLLLHDVARNLTPLGSWSPPEALTYAQLLWTVGQRDRLRGDSDLLAALDPADRLSVDVDLAAHADGVASAAWGDAMAQLLGPVSGVTVVADAPTPFDGLRAVDAPAPVDGPLVSVIMSAYRPGPELVTSVRSILDQSWRNLELLVVDDASGPAYDEMLGRVAALDPRIRVIVQPENRGTYAARNLALSQARGDFVTFQDSDDWSHPERIVRQVQRLVDDPDLPAVMSRSIRCTPDLELQLLGYRTSRPNVSSLLLRRATIEALGDFDHVRKGADSEYEQRIAAYFGRRVAVMPERLAFVRLDPESLSRSDFRPGWWHPTRYAYRDGYRHWHRSVEAGTSPRISPGAKSRGFHAPRAFLRATGHHLDDGRVDFLFVADWREVGGAQATLLQQMRTLVAGGLRVGVMHLESLRALECRTDAVSLEIQELVHTGFVMRVVPDEPVIVDRLVLGDPALLNYERERMAGDVRQVAILAAMAPANSVTGDLRYLPAAVTETVRATWSVDPVWIPGGDSVRAALEGTGVRMSSMDLGGSSSPDVAPPRATRRDRPIIGAPVGAAEDHTPAPEELVQLFGEDDRFDVRLVAPVELARSPDQLPDHWLFFRPEAMTQRDLFRELDFFVSPFGTDATDQVVPRVIDAVSAGAVAIVPPSYESALGNAAVYSSPDEVGDTVRRLFADPGLYAAAVVRGQKSIAEMFEPTVLDVDFDPLPAKGTE